MAPSYDNRKVAFAARLKSARLRKGYSQERVAADAGLSRRHYIRLENGEHFPQTDVIERIAEVVGVTPAVLAGDEEDEEAALPFARDLAASLLAVIDERVAHHARQATA